MIPTFQRLALDPQSLQEAWNQSGKGSSLLLWAASASQGRALTTSRPSAKSTKNVDGDTLQAAHEVQCL